MKKTIAKLTLSTMLLTMPGINSVLAQSVETQSVKTLTTKKISLETLISNFKFETFSKGSDFKTNLEVLTQNIMLNNYTTSDLINYVALNSTPEDAAKFKKILLVAAGEAEALNSLNAIETEMILTQALTSTNTTGSHFMSCSTGLSIGVPILIAGVVVGIIAIVNASATKKFITQDYIAKKEEQAYAHNNTIADLEFEKTTYESDIIYYQDEINEYERLIATNTFSVAEVNEMKVQIRELNFYISDAQALLGEVQVDYDYFVAQYASDTEITSQQESNELSRIDERKKNSGAQAIAAGIFGAVGTTFILASASDCN